MYEENIHDLKKALEEQKISYNENELNKVYNFAEKIYEDKKRYKNKTVLEHAIGVALEVVNLRMDDKSVYAALLHEAPKSESYDYEEIEEKFGEDVSDIVKGAFKLSYLNYRNQDKLEIEKLRNMFMAIAKDVRVVIVKLCDRLYNMRKIKELEEDVQQVKAKETLEIYAPIAHRLGMSSIKSELEDISFRTLLPKEYEEIKKIVDVKKEQREKYIADRIVEISNELKKNGINNTIYGRPKHFYSIYKKMQEKDCTIDSLYDLLAIRIIVDSVKDCYSALGLVHEMYKPMPGRFKDYIAVPKTNMYQSLHTTVFGEGTLPFEVQIRTWDMHKIADYGVAAHFLYKEKNSKMSETDKKLVWLRQKLEFQKELAESDEYISDVKVELFGEEVFVFTPKGDIKALPKDSTPVDFAYAIHQGVAEKMVGAKINGKIVPISTKLNNTDVVDIIISATSVGPKRDWLKFVKTTSAKNKIITFLKKQGRESNIVKGKELFEKEFRKHKIVKEEVFKDDIIENFLKKVGFNNLDECYENIGFGSISPAKVISRLVDEYEKYYKNLSIINQDIEAINELNSKNQLNSKKENRKKNIDSGVIVEGIDNCLVKYAKCCSPIPGDEIVGYITFGKGVSIHRKDCVNLTGLDVDNRRINVKWKDKVSHGFETSIQILSNDRDGVVSDVLKKLQELKTDLVSINARKTKEKESIIDLVVNTKNAEDLQKTIKTLKKVDSVFDVKRAK